MLIKPGIVYCELMLTRSGWLLSNSSEMVTFTEQLLSALERQDVVDLFSLIFEHQLKSHLDPVTVKLTDAIHALTQTVTQLKGEIKSRHDTIRSLQCEVTELQTRIEDLEQHGHRDSLRIFGYPEEYLVVLMIRSWDCATSALNSTLPSGRYCCLPSRRSSQEPLSHPPTPDRTSLPGQRCTSLTI